jgi:hypothetical protein
MLSLRLSAVLLVLPLMPLWGQNAEPGLAELEALTPVGAKRDGNAAGTIPAWTGGLTEAPANYSPQFHETDPFADDQPLFTIDAGNAAKYADNLSPGQRALLEQYPETWRLHVYPSRRTAAYPQFVYDALAANAESAQLITEGRGGVNGSDITSPFPQPENGLEVIWNHNLRWRGIRVQRSQGTAAVTRAGNFTLVLDEQDWGFPYGFRNQTAFKQRYPNLLLAVKSKTVEPDFLSGNPRKTWNYVRSLRRIIRAPYTGYELPAGNTDGLRTVDDFGLYNGPPDRYDWRLIGKRELYIPYNSYRAHSSDLSPKNLVMPGHLNPEHLRYELHRVWEVEAVLKADARHIYGRRVFYLDEDSWQIAVADSYDLDGKLWRVNEAHAVNFYTVPVLWSTLEVFHDLQPERVLINGLDNRRRPHRFLNTGDPREFSPNALIYYLR